MILTITMNPTLDYVYFIENFKLDKQNRFSTPLIMPGGKGINMARAASLIDGEIINIVVLGGMKGKYIYKSLIKENFNLIKFTIDGESRNGITIMHDNNKQTQIVEPGPLFKDNYKEKFFKLVADTIVQNNIKVITVNGSINTNDNYFYLDLLKFIRLHFAKSIKVIFDISGYQLENVFFNEDVSPDAIKPNEDEFGELFHLKDINENLIIDSLKKSQSNIDTIIVSRGKEGAIVKKKNKLYKISIPIVKVVNTTGSGDSVIAGLAVAMDNDFDFYHQIKYAMACGISNAQHKGVGEVNKHKINKMFENITVEMIN